MRTDRFQNCNTFIYLLKLKIKSMSTPTKVSFWRIFWPSLIAGMVLSVIGWIFWLVLLSSAFSEEPEIKDKTVLHLELNGEIAERSDSKFNPGAIGVDSKIGLADILSGIKRAKDDESVSGIYVDLGNLSCGYATAREIRKALIDFQKGKKFCIAYLHGEVVTQKQYYIASAAEKCYGFKNSNMELVGLGAELTFYKKLFDKFGIEMQVIRGSNNDFKSAVEPFFRENMSDSSKLQVNRYMQSIWNTVSADISKSRNLTGNKLNTIVENVAVRNVEDAVEQKLIDKAIYEDEMETILVKEAGIESIQDLEHFEDYAKRYFKNRQMSIQEDESANVAVIVAEGSIMVGGDEVSSTKICKYFREVRQNDKIKVVVFRVNSPGGSALASEEIWREVMLTKKKKKVIVSMGDVAASGGYYISTPGDRIFAEPSTITGSIGVFGTIPYTGAALENNLGLTFDRVQTHSHSVLSLNRRLTPEELLLVQNEVDDIYLQFKQRVADGRKLTLTQVERLARGRVWTGEDALKYGLVDELGGLEDAIAYAIKEAKVSDPTIIYYPKEKESALDTFLEEFSKNEDIQANIKQSKFQILKDDWFEKIQLLEQFNGIQMRLPYQVEIY